jgi:hypothetical protein
MPFLNLHYYKPAILPKEELAWADVIHVHGISALSDFLVLTKHRHRKPIVLNTHGGLFHTQSLAGIKKMYFFGGQKIMLKGVDLVVADSPHDFELFKPIAPRIVLIENGVDFSALSKKTKKKSGWSGSMEGCPKAIFPWLFQSKAPAKSSGKRIPRWQREQKKRRTKLDNQWRIESPSAPSLRFSG